jgi:hypothetical protein
MANSCHGESEGPISDLGLADGLAECPAGSSWSPTLVSSSASPSVEYRNTFGGCCRRAVASGARPDDRKSAGRVVVYTMTLKKPEAENRTPETAVTAKGIWVPEASAGIRAKDIGSVYVKMKRSD